MDRRHVAVAVAGRGLTRDVFLRHALADGAGEALWIEPDAGWVERYSLPRDGLFRRRRLLWPGDAAILGPRAA